MQRWQLLTGVVLLSHKTTSDPEAEAVEKLQLCLSPKESGKETHILRKSDHRNMLEQMWGTTHIPHSFCPPTLCENFRAGQQMSVFKVYTSKKSWYWYTFSTYSFGYFKPTMLWQLNCSLSPHKTVSSWAWPTSNYVRMQYLSLQKLWQSIRSQFLHFLSHHSLLQYGSCSHFPWSPLVYSLYCCSGAIFKTLPLDWGHIFKSNTVHLAKWQLKILNGNHQSQYI